MELVRVARPAEKASAGAEAANSGDDQAEEELPDLVPEVRILGHTPRGDQPATNSWVATSVPDGTSRVDTTQEVEEQAAAECEAWEICQGSVSKEWAAEEEEELNYLLAENLAEVAGSLAQRARA